MNKPDNSSKKEIKKDSVKSSYIKSKENYDRWRKANPNKQAWHQFNHSRRQAGKKEYSYEEYIELKNNKDYINNAGYLNAYKVSLLQ